MAIRPEISLQAGKIPQGGGIASGVERGMKLQQLAMQPAILEQQLSTARQAEQASRAATEISQAQLPGVQAQAAGLVRGERQANQRIAAAQAAIETDEGGAPVIDTATGQPRFNLNKYQYGLYKAGLVDEATKSGAEMLKQSKDVYEFAASTRTQVALAAQAAYDRTVGTPDQKQKAAEATWRDMSGRALQAAQAGGFPLSEDQLRYTPGLEKALYTASINPQAQETLKQGMAAQDLQRDQLALQVEQFDNSKIAGFTDEASMDPNSPQSQMARQVAINAGLQVDERMSAGEMFRNDLYKGALGSVGAAVGAARLAAQGEVSQYASTLKTLESAKTVLAKNGITPLQLLQNKVNRTLLDDPALAALQAQLQRLPPGMVTEGQGYESLKAILDAQRKHAEANAAVAVGGPAQSRTSPAQPGAAPAQPGQPAAQPAGNFVVGKIYQNPKGERARYTGDKNNPWEILQ
jgi:hypothetical protein